ncbi:hypothetical protein ZIOFF_029838 [Zingiber officinale]|uniref:Pectinesterase n=1 Tax=Zingiber officinale TaxID=94328 RepID=A0A8J5GX85_ZINOF|nr:hypothetical protein ZIOFF_029838 [Zingiber officinale]
MLSYFLNCTSASMAWGALHLLAFFLLCFIVVGLDVVVPVNQSVRVAQDNTDNFNTIGEAITFALNNTLLHHLHQRRGVPGERDHAQEENEPYFDCSSIAALINGVGLRQCYGMESGTDNFNTIGEAIAFAPNDTTVEEGGYFAIYVNEGAYRENVFVPEIKKNLILIGAGADRTVITSNRNVEDGWETYDIATFGSVHCPQDMTFENTAGSAKQQVVAMRNNADLSIFYRCKFLGYQDTLYVHSNNQFYRDCEVHGTIDFIFGDATAVFQNCHIYARLSLQGQVNVVTAQGRTLYNESIGFSIHNCTIGAASELVAANYSMKTFLGRPWKEFSRTVYMQSYIEGIVEAAGWMTWNGSFALNRLYYGEYQNYGPGAATSGRVQCPGYRLMNVTDVYLHP